MVSIIMARTESGASNELARKSIVARESAIEAANLGMASAHWSAVQFMAQATRIDARVERPRQPLSRTRATHSK
jgi:hypothetical protein